MFNYVFIVIILISISIFDAKPIDDQPFVSLSIQQHRQLIALNPLLRIRRALNLGKTGLSNVNTGGTRLGSSLGGFGTKGTFGTAASGNNAYNLGLGNNFDSSKIKGNSGSGVDLNSFKQLGINNRFSPSPGLFDNFSPAGTLNPNIIPKIPSWTNPPSSWGINPTPNKLGDGTLVDFGYKGDNWRVGIGPVISDEGAINGGGVNVKINFP